ncbi:MAG TPA: hypothetical protein VFL30_08585 [Rhodanobacteraceae bacterium]|nr:hypothetical protein [Rhodanobacteraceae bacterium]
MATDVTKIVRLLLPAALFLGAAVFSFDSAAQKVHATKLTSVSPAHCVASLERGVAADPLRCPSALRGAVAEAQAMCRQAGGTFTGAAEGNVWAIDVNADGRNELAFSLADNLSCTGASSLFACGSLRCPKSLYELRDGAWQIVGSISAETPEQVTLGPAASDGHHSLEVCSQDRCAERRIYEWQGKNYEPTRASP